MTKDELIDYLTGLEGNPRILVDGHEDGYMDIQRVREVRITEFTRDVVPLYIEADEGEKAIVLSRYPTRK